MILPFGEKAYHSIKQKFGLPEDFLHLTVKKGSRSLDYTTQVEGKTLQCQFYKRSTVRIPLTLQGFIYKFVLYQPIYYYLALSYDKSTKLTHGLLLAMISSNKFPSLITSLKSRKIYCSQPLLLASLVAELVIDSCTQKIEIQDTELNKLEEDMGQHKHINRPIGDPFKMDFKAATQALNFISRTLSLNALRLGGTCLTLEKIMQDTKGIVDERLVELQGSGQDAEVVNLNRGWQMMKNLEAYLINCCRNQELRVLYEEKRAKTQSAAVREILGKTVR
jgi:hypothetical protein